MPDDIPQSPDQSDDTAMLRAALAAADVRIAALEQIIKGFRRARFGQSSERVEAGQLALELGRAPVLPEPANDTSAKPRDRQDPGQRRRNRGALPSHLERIEEVLDLPDQGCPCCGVAMRRIGEDRSERLDVVPAQLRVPHRLARAVVDARVTERTVELFHNGGRVAAHPRSPLRHRHTTTPDHMPSSHRRHADWTPARLRRDAAAIGSAAAGMVEAILAAKPHPEQRFRACLGILGLVRGYGAGRVEAACQRGLDIGARSYGSIASILRNGLDRAYAPEPVPDTPPIRHPNIRGGSYYH